MLMKQVDPLDIKIPETCVIVLVQKINAGRRLRVFKTLGEAGKNAESYDDFAVVVPKDSLKTPAEMISYADSVDESEHIEIGKILSQEAPDA